MSYIIKIVCLIIFSIQFSCKNEVDHVQEKVDLTDYFRLPNQKLTETKYFKVIGDSSFITRFKVVIETIHHNPLELQYTVFYSENDYKRSKKVNQYFKDGLKFKSYSMFQRDAHYYEGYGHMYIETKCVLVDSTKLFKINDSLQSYPILYERNNYVRVNVNVRPYIELKNDNFLGPSANEYLAISEREYVKVDYLNSTGTDTTMTSITKEIYQKHKGLVYFEEERNNIIYRYKLIDSIY